MATTCGRVASFRNARCVLSERVLRPFGTQAAFLRILARFSAPKRLLRPRWTLVLRPVGTQRACSKKQCRVPGRRGTVIHFTECSSRNAHGCVHGEVFEARSDVFEAATAARKAACGHRIETGRAAWSDDVQIAVEVRICITKARIDDVCFGA